jgi:hypothetical protein
VFCDSTWLPAMLTTAELMRRPLWRSHCSTAAWIARWLRQGSPPSPLGRRSTGKRRLPAAPAAHWACALPARSTSSSCQYPDRQ